MDFDAALKLAQEKGYAEKNPAADIEGHDACRKICILAALGFGKHVYPEQVETEGITDITLDDISAADSFGYVIKLIGHARKNENGKITAFVKPVLVSRECILSGVNGVFNAVMVTGDQTGEVVFYGKGAGKEATASAVVADIIDCIKHLDTRKYLFWSDGEKDYVEKDNKKHKFLVRIKSDDFAALAETFSKVFSLNTDFIKNEYSKEIAFITEEDFEDNIKEKLEAFRGCEIKLLNILF